ncbi:MAG: hypothetical protein HY851_03810 [candidate division Zixibacteria bacterium]|nr:hypothetical protein [candidate division Zixibacteria bacterium]
MAVPSKKKAQAVGTPEAVNWPFGKKNYIWFGVALGVMIIGYILLGTGDITLAPLLLVIAYCVLIPVAILVKGRPDTAPSANQ